MTRKIRAVVKSVLDGSPAAEAGLKPGDFILGVDGYEMIDIIDWRFMTSDYEFTLQVERDGAQFELEVAREEMSDLGVEFEDILFDGIRECANRCLFCFVDQLPDGARPSLCIKDDDYRLSFLQGSFVTLTNCSTRTLDRIIGYRMSPLYISVHATDPEVRNKLLGRKMTKPIMEVLEYLVRNGIEVHTQIVIVPGINDGEVLKQSISDLAGLVPGVLSIGVVPVGLTRHRKKFKELRTVSLEEANVTIQMISSMQEDFLERYGTRLVWAADEYYLKANAQFPEDEDYEGYVQLDNGIGLTRSFYKDFDEVLLSMSWKKSDDASKTAIVTGVDGARVIDPLLRRIRTEYGAEPKLIAVHNSFFGYDVTVSGLVTGKDIINAVKDAVAGNSIIKTIMLPDIMIRRGDCVLLDGMTPADVAEGTGAKVLVVPTSAEGLLNASGIVRRA